MNSSYFPRSSNPGNRGQWYLWIIRIAAGCVAPILWWVSYTFSVKGFAFFLPEWIWVGQIFGVVFSILELMFNRGVSKHPTLFYAGIFAYIYSIGTNLLGLFTASDLSTLQGPMVVLSGLMLIILAFGLDILPESMLVWSLYPNEPIITGDFVSSLMKGVQVSSGQQNSGQRTDVHRTNVPNMRSNRPNMGFGQRNDVFMDNELDEPLDMSNKMDGQQNGRTGGQMKNKVRSYVFRNTRPGKALSSREIAGKLGISKSSVAEILREMREKGEIKF